MDGGLRVASTLDANGSAEPFFFWLRISLWAERDVRDVSVWTLAGALLMALGWFLANTYPPWLSAWLEAAALASAVVFSGAAWHLARGRLTPTTFTLSTPLVALTLLTLGSLVLQCVAGVMLFTGDAMMVVAYLLAWMLAMHAGHVIAMASTPHNLDVFWFTLLVSAIAAIGLALVQWLNVSGLGIFVLDMRAGGRPYANLGQPNNFCTLCFLGCAGALYFYERGKLCGAAFWFVWSWLCFGMALSQSRTGWLQMASLVVGLWWAGRKISLRMGGVKIFSLGASFAVLVLILPELAHALGITVGRTLGEQMHGGVRMQYWLSMLHAVTQRPWLGYGWLQTGLAQQLEASSNLHRGIFDFAHNIVLDVVLWTGLPLGLIIVLCSGGWMLQTARSLSSGTGIAAMLALSGVLIHALVEYPLAYAYFLVPVGFFMGMLQSTCASKAGWSMGRRLMAVCALSAAGLFLLIAYDYFRAENAIRELRFESARIGLRTEAVPVPRMLLLTQLQALMRHGYRDPPEDMSRDEWLEAGRTSERYGLSFVLFRYALASAFFGEPETARATLQRLCRIHDLAKCRQADAEWQFWGERYPATVGSISFPLH